ncbi:DUF6975 family protein [Stakelama pacifica]|uniref:Uncharacterized protein n=1 Tax=Stakelama pacifica TaxID=517720 RepID=A0A4R6FXW0_9SPHN|nr:hypothetical protein [Stakelama pacifica]TDN86637.1 hypothetical protein EV664_101211 [Stakelama pacifica]GGO90236.1 hypothetical protein GCM10011329_02070 [Stakelama pacifica]
MPAQSNNLPPSDAIWAILCDLDRSEGSGAHRFVRHLADPAAPMSDIADAVHCLCVIHGNHPGLFDLATENPGPEAVRNWLQAAAAHFHEERVLLVTLVAAAGPPRGTPGSAEAEATVAGQRHALEILARSDRTGCAIGAAMGLALEWRAIRHALDHAAGRLDVTPAPLNLPDETETRAMLHTLAPDSAVERAILFGYRQLLAQHRGLWDLLQARAEARNRT